MALNAISFLVSFAIVSLRKRELVPLLLLSSSYHVTVIALCIFLTVLLIGLQQCMILIVLTNCFLSGVSQLRGSSNKV